jgi:hypothetical protein
MTRPVREPFPPLSYAYDFQTIQALSAPSDEIGVGLLVKQGHDYYVADYGGVGQNGWNHLTGILQASDFMHLMGAGPETPDFTTQGSPLEIGYFTAHTCEGWQWLTWGLANFQVTINGTSFTDNRFRQTDWTQLVLRSDDLGAAQDARSATITVAARPG